MKKVERRITFCLLVFLLCAISIRASAAGELPDLERRGSITVTVRDTETKTPVSGGRLTLYQVASAEENDWNFSFAYTKKFAGCGLSLEKIQSEDLADGLAEYAASQKIKGITAVVGNDGRGTFSNLETGLYLITQDVPAKGHTGLMPFLVSIPYKDGETLIYDVDAAPKAGTVGEAPQETKPSKPTASKLPQTGQLWWPVPFLAIAGILLITLGWVKRKHANS